MDSYQPYTLMFLSSLMNNNEQRNNIFFFLTLVMPFLLKIIPTHLIYDFILDYFTNDNNYAKITIRSHSIPVVRSYSNAKHTKIIYSESFLAIVYYLNNNKLINLSCLTEILTNSNELNLHSDYTQANKNTFILIPLQKNRIKICNLNNIYCEFNTVENKDTDNDDKKNLSSTINNNYIIVLSKKKTINKNETDITILKDFLNKCEKNFQKSKLNNNSNLYNFEYKGSEKSENGNLILHFNEHIMEHNKDLTKNIFFEDKDKLIKYIKPFIYDPSNTINSGEELYIKSGFTFKAGLLFYGSPGCGKTSTIKAILKYTNRNAIILNLSKIKSCEELENIFRIRKINDKTYCGKQLCFILEDCDAFNLDVIKSREDNKIIGSKENNDNKENNENKEINKLTELSSLFVEYSLKKLNTDELNLSCFLNILDGIIELHGVMIILTTNYPEKIDDALIRPGRIDFKYEFKKATNKTICNMLQFKFDINDEDFIKYEALLKKIKNNILSPAEIQSICFKNDTIEECIEDIVKLSEK